MPRQPTSPRVSAEDPAAPPSDIGDELDARSRALRDEAETEENRERQPPVGPGQRSLRVDLDDPTAPEVGSRPTAISKSEPVPRFPSVTTEPPRLHQILVPTRPLLERRHSLPSGGGSAIDPRRLTDRHRSDPAPSRPSVGGSALDHTAAFGVTLSPARTKGTRDGELASTTWRAEPARSGVRPDTPDGLGERVIRRIPADEAHTVKGARRGETSPPENGRRGMRSSTIDPRGRETSRVADDRQGVAEPATGAGRARVAPGPDARTGVRRPEPHPPPERRPLPDRRGDLSRPQGASRLTFTSIQGRAGCEVRTNRASFLAR